VRVITPGVALDFEFASTNHSIRTGLTEAVCGLKAMLGDKLVVFTSYPAANNSFEWDFIRLDKCLDFWMPMEYSGCAYADVHNGWSARRAQLPCLSYRTTNRHLLILLHTV
jgi:hypothetical protein